MKKLLFILLIAICNIATAQTEYFVSNSGSNGNSGTSIAQAWRSPEYAVAQLNAGDTLTLMPDTFYTADVITIDPYAWPTPIGESGTAEAKITIRGHPDSIAIGKRPQINCKYHEDSIPDPGWNIYNSAFNLNRVEYITFKDIDVTQVYQIDSTVAGAYNVISCANITYENLRVWDIGQRAFYHTSGAWSYADSAYAYYLRGAEASPYFDQPDTTKWINCDVWDVCDTLAYTPGNAGDAWKVISYWGNYYEWNGCRAWNYSDDAFDPNNGQRRFIDCWAMSSNKYVNPDPAWDTENNGFKTTGYGAEVELGFYTPSDSAAIVEDSLVIFERCIAMFCNGSGYVTNLLSVRSTHNRYYNCTGYKNGINYVLGGGGGSPWDTITDVIYNSIAYAATTTNATGNDYNVASGSSPYFISNSSWISNGYANSDNPAYNNDANQYVTLDSLTLVRWFTQDRDTDFSLPTDSVPMMLADTSSFIDNGYDGYWVDSYNGTGPDIGYHEFSGTASYPPVANFEGDTLNRVVGESVNFTDLSTNTPTSWSWTFEQGTPSSSSAQNPTIQYDSVGIWDVTLQATNADGSDTEVKSNYVTVTSGVVTPPVADFSANQVTIYEGDSITFTDLSTNTPTSWNWIIEGATVTPQTVQNPTAVYNTSGIYLVSLTATNAGGYDTEVKNAYITVLDKPYWYDWGIRITSE
jgi:PKD repeat protein